MNEHVLRHHVGRMFPLLLRLHRSGRSNPVVWAVMLSETFFRPPGQRLVEYLAWIVLGAAAPRYATRISAGIAQVQIRHWVALGILRGPRPSPESLRRLASVELNYDVCAALLMPRAGAEGLTVRRVAAVYRGEARSYHVRILAGILKIVLDLPMFAPGVRSGRREG